MMHGHERLGCRRCEMRYWARFILRGRFQYCDRCKAKIRMTQEAWRAWSTGRVPLALDERGYKVDGTSRDQSPLMPIGYEPTEPTHRESHTAT